MNFLSLLKRNLIYKFKIKKNIDEDIFEDDVSLDFLFEYYKTDKANKFKNIVGKGHGYSAFYEKHFEEFRSQKINLLEIGSYSGASAAAFIKYFKNIKIYCLDINLTRFQFKSKHIFTYGIDVNNKKSISNFLKKINFDTSIGKFDIIIDDGSHILSDQLKSLNYFFKYLKIGGCYVIEEYRFPEYYKHLKDTEECSINDLFEDIIYKGKANNKFIEISTIKSLVENSSNVFKYKGNHKDSDILFIKKNN